MGLDEYISNFSAYYTIIIKQEKEMNKFWQSKKNYKFCYWQFVSQFIL